MAHLGWAGLGGSQRAGAALGMSESKVGPGLGTVGSVQWTPLGSYQLLTRPSLYLQLRPPAAVLQSELSVSDLFSLLEVCFCHRWLLVTHARHGVLP